MRKTIIYGIILVSALLMPNEAMELGKMKPVEAVSVKIEDETVIIETDTDDMGRGATVAQAMQNLKETTAGTIFMDTANYLLVEEGAENLVPELSKYLKKGIRICKVEGEINSADAVEFLHTHSPGIKLEQWQKNMKLEILKEENGRLIIE